MSHPRRLSLTRVENSPVGPSPRACRAVLAQVFNRDDWTSGVTWAEAAVILAAKLLKDAGYDDDHVVAIFRYFRDSIVRWADTMEGMPDEARNMLVLVIMDNRRASLLGAPYDSRIFEFRMGVQATPAPPVPILQLSVALSGLLSLLVASAGSDPSCHAGAEEPAVAASDRPASP